MKVIIKKGEKINKNIIKGLEKIDENIVACIGGDGTILYALKHFNKPCLLIRLPNKKSLGFRGDTTIENLKAIEEKIRKKEFYKEQFKKIEVIQQNKKIEVFNDVVIFRRVAKEIGIEIIEENEKVLEFFGDGVIITSSFGCTAYNFKANGPITKEKDILIITPINSNIKNSYITKKELKVFITKGKAKLEIDGENFGNVKEIKVNLSKKTFEIVKLKGFEESFSSKINRIIVR
ncbi:MAG: hypothetical protein QXG91_01375 [Candidatus Aenigmatarchaeota archaeon]